MEDKIPEMIGKYKIKGLIAKGGMGAVYKAVHPTLNRLVILKKLTIRSNATVLKRFKREAQILVDLQSAYIVHLFDYFIEDRSHYIVEEYVDGMSLADLIEKQVSLGTEVSLLVFLDACYALKYAHRQGIVHRDIKPGNILISRLSEVKLADFGIASSEKGDDLPVSKETVKTTTNAELTQSGVMLGTPAYMSPEQISDSRSVDKRADIYSMGVMLYEMLTGSKPFPSTLSASTLAKIRKGKYVSPRKIDKSIPRFICRMIHYMLKANPNQRYQSVEPIIKIVNRYLSHYDRHAIRLGLAQAVITKKQFKIPAFQPKKQIAQMVVVSLLGAASLISGFFWLKQEGVFHATLLRHWYTPVKISMALPATASVASDLPARAFFFVDDGPSGPEIKGTRRVFVKQRSSAAFSDGDAVVRYETKPVYMRHGAYRVKVAVGPYVVWQTLSVEKKAVDVNLEDLQKARRALKIHAQAFDSQDGRNITAFTSFSIWYNGKYVPLANIPPRELVTGSTWDIRAESRGYETATFALIIDWYQDDLRIVARLQPKS